MGVIADGDGWLAVVLTLLCCNLRLLLARAQALALAQMHDWSLEVASRVRSHENEQLEQ